MNQSKIEADRRAVLKGIGWTAALAMFGNTHPAAATTIAPADGSIAFKGGTIQFVDMTHKLTKAFNFGQAKPRIAAEPIDGSGKAAGMRLNRLSLVEHTGTHIDAPNHFDEGGASLGEIPIGDLIVPLAILDLREKLAANGSAEVEPADIERWENRHGRLPEGCCVALWSGIDPLSPFKTQPRPITGSRLIMPGFGPGVIDLLMKRAVKGVAVDTMTIDSSNNTPSYPFHKAWLSSGRWGIEGLTNLAAVPPTGAVLIVGAPPIEGATGMPIRALALF